MPIRTEILDGGLVNARDPALLSDGELQRTNDAIYRPNSPGLWSSPGRTLYGTVQGSTPVKGLAYIRFDGTATNLQTKFVVGYTGTRYDLTEFIAKSGTFALGAFTGVGNGPYLNAVLGNNRHYLFNGNSDGVANQVIKLDQNGALAIRNQGLQPVVTAPTLATAAGAAWPSAADFGDGFYFFFNTEVINIGDVDELESTFQGVPAFISVVGTTDGVLLSNFPALANSTATHRRIYVVGPKFDSQWFDNYFVEAQLVAEIDTGQTTLTLGGVDANTQSSLPGDTASSTCASPNNALTENNTDATSKFNGEILQVNTFTFNTGTITTVRGVQIEIKYRYLSGAGWPFKVEVNNGSGWSPISHNGGFLGNAGSHGWNNPYGLAIVGGPTDLWGLAWVAANFGGASFKVRLTFADLPGTDSITRYGVDYVRAKVFYANNAQVVKKDFFPTTVVQIGSLVTVVGTNAPPPISSTGDLYEDQMIQNDVSNPRRAVYSAPGQYDYYPPVYFIYLEDAEAITLIRRIHSKLLMATTNRLFRVNFLPRAEDTEFSTGRCYESLSPYGIPNPNAACVFAPSGLNEQLAFVSYNGFHYTNGFQVDTLTNDIDFPGMVNITQLTSCFMVNYSLLYSLVFFYIPADDITSTYPTRALWLSYHSGHMKEGGKLKVSGPVKTAASSAIVAPLNLIPTMVFGHNSNGNMYVDDNGNSDALGLGPFPDVISRDFYPSGVGRQNRCKRMYARYAAVDFPMVVTVTPFRKNTGLAYASLEDSSTWTPKTFRTDSGFELLPGAQSTLTNVGGLVRIDGDFGFESFCVRFLAASPNGEPAGSMVLYSISYDSQETGNQQ
jgi:hypothetical protein